MVPGFRHEQRPDPACDDALRQQRSSCRRILLQGIGARVADRDCDRSARRERGPIDQGLARLLMPSRREDAYMNRERTIMSVYTVHIPPSTRRGSASGPERFVFVRDGFSFWAFLLVPLWMLWHRLWLVFVGYCVLAIALQGGLQAITAF